MTDYYGCGHRNGVLHVIVSNHCMYCDQHISQIQREQGHVYDVPGAAPVKRSPALIILWLIGILAITCAFIFSLGDPTI